MLGDKNCNLQEASARYVFTHLHFQEYDNFLCSASESKKIESRFHSDCYLTLQDLCIKQLFRAHRAISTGHTVTAPRCLETRPSFLHLTESCQLSVLHPSQSQRSLLLELINLLNIYKDYQHSSQRYVSRSSAALHRMTNESTTARNRSSERLTLENKQLWIWQILLLTVLANVSRLHVVLKAFLLKLMIMKPV